MKRVLLCRLLASASITMAIAVSVHAEGIEPKPCDAFSWPVSREIALFSSPDMPIAESGDVLPSLGSIGLLFKLMPFDKVTFASPPGRVPKSPNSFAGVLSFSSVPQEGAYQVTISEGVWIDIIQDGTAVPSTASSGQKNCAVVHKSVRFDLKQGPLTLQLSGAAGDTVRIAIVPAR